MALNFLSNTRRDRTRRSFELSGLAASYSHRESDNASKGWLRSNLGLRQIASNANSYSDLARQLARRNRTTFNDFEYPFQLYSKGENTFGIRKGTAAFPSFWSLTDTQQLIDLHQNNDVIDIDVAGEDYDFTVSWDSSSAHGNGVFVWFKITQTAAAADVVTLNVSDFIDSSFVPFSVEHHLVGVTDIYFPIGAVNFVDIDKTDTTHWIINSWTFDQYPVTNFGSFPYSGTYRNVWHPNGIYYPGDTVTSGGIIYLWGLNITMTTRLMAGVNFDPAVGGSGWFALT